MWALSDCWDISEESEFQSSCVCSDRDSKSRRLMWLFSLFLICSFIFFVSLVILFLIDLSVSSEYIVYMSIRRDFMSWVYFCATESGLLLPKEFSRKEIRFSDGMVNFPGLSW